MNDGATRTQLYAALDRLVGLIRAFVRSYASAAPLTTVFAATNLIIHAGVAMGGRMAIEALWEIGAVSPYASLQVWRLFTAGWIHYNAEHVVGNVVVLLVMGRLLEPAVGSRRFAGIYLIALLGANVVSLFMGMDYSAGASGAICGIIGALLVIPVCIRLSRAIWAWVTVALFVALSMSGEPAPEVNVAAHITGMVLGMIAGVFSGLGAQSAVEPPDAPLVFSTNSPSLQAAIRIPHSYPVARRYERGSFDA